MRLNPFVYISETDIRFYLIVAVSIIMPSLWMLIFVLVFFSVAFQIEITIFHKLSILVPILIFNILFIYWNYKNFPRKILRKTKYKKFNQKKFPDHFEYINKLYQQFSSIGKQPTLIYQPFDRSESAFTFGIKHNFYVAISGGMIITFRKSLNKFKSIFLHEIGHLANRDVEKTYLATAASRSLSFILPISLGILVIPSLYYQLGMLYNGIVEGYDLTYIISRMNLDQWGLIVGGLAIYFLFFWLFTFLLRNQLVRYREFYADARVVEWEDSPEDIIKTLEESEGKQHSKFEMLTKFHPNINERIKVLKNNVPLFELSLLIPYIIGFFYNEIEMRLSILKTVISTWEFSNQAILIPELNVEFRAFISIFIFTALMLAISSSLHKLILKDLFIKKKRYFSSSTILTMVKFSLVFSFGYLSANILSYIESGPFALDLINELPIYPQVWVLMAIDLSFALIFIVFFGSKLIRRSFSKRDAKKKFVVVTILGSFLYILNRYVAVESFHNRLLLIVFLLIFSIPLYIFIRRADKKLNCPNCNVKISNLKELELNCPNCNHNLYSWAFVTSSQTKIHND